MSSINEIHLECNPKFKIDFTGGNLSSDFGLTIIKEFADKIGFTETINHLFTTNDSAVLRRHTDQSNLLQCIYQIIGAYNSDDSADALRYDPVFTSLLNKDALASQPTLSRFYNRMDESTLALFEQINAALREKVYAIKKPPFMLMDLDTTLLKAYGNQEGVAYNVHYQDTGYHPILCYDGMTHDLLKVGLRDGTQYCSKDTDAFLESLLAEYRTKFPGIPLILRADSGFAADNVYRKCDEHDCDYVIRLKENNRLLYLATDGDKELYELAKKNISDYAVVYGEFMYQACSWDHPRRVVYKIEKQKDQFLHEYTFVVTTLTSAPNRIIKLYSKRGNMENFIKEGKNEFDFAAVSSASKIVNACRLQVHMLAYNLFNWFRRLALPEYMRKMQADTIRLMLLKVAVRVVRKARYLYFKVCSSFPYQSQLMEIVDNIRKLRVRVRPLA